MAIRQALNLQAALSMTTNLTELMPSDLFAPDKIAPAIKWIRLNVSQANIRRATLCQWATIAGVLPNAHHYNFVATPLPTGGHNALPEV